jgi:CHAT domain-containing protein
MILPPAAGKLRARRLLIIPDGALQYISFTVLPEPGAEIGESPRLLVESHQIVELPSASAVLILRNGRRARRPAALRVALFADPAFGADSDLPRLPNSRREADYILSLVPPGKSFAAFGPDANLKTVKGREVGEAEILHFATHGRLGTRPELSGIYLSELDGQGHPRAALLHALDIYNLDLSADLVVLSACETALGDDLRGEGVGRLTRAFLYAGAKSVVVSLWSVSDAATAELMKRFYAGMLRQGLSPAEALRQAQLEIRQDKRWTAPYYWAGFVLQGDWK